MASSTPEQFTGSSNKRVWWKCAVARDHEWPSTIDNRTQRQSGCPCCAGRQPSVTNCVGTQFPDIAREWHATKNDMLTPESVACGYRTKVWWTCAEGPEHDYKATPNSRTRNGTGCPTCAGKLVSSTNSLAARGRDVAARWHPTKNRETSPADVLWATSKSYWWKCPEGPDHEWKAPVSRLTSAGQGCPFCRGMRVSVTNSISAINPDAAAEWHPTKNAPLSPADVVAGSNKSFWWQCARDSGHEWEAAANNRCARNGLGSGCPHCAPPQDSWQQVCLSFELSAFFELDVDDHAVNVPEHKRRWNVDVVLRSERIAIEFDGLYWHKSPEAHDRDKRKSEALESDGWHVIRVREYPLKPIGPNDVVVPYKDAKRAAVITLRRLQQLVGYELAGLEEYMSKPQLLQEASALEYMQWIRKGRPSQRAAGS